MHIVITGFAFSQRIHLDERAAIESFEDIPIIPIVIVTAFLFMMSFTKAYLSYARFHEETKIDEQLTGFTDSILRYEPLLFRSKTGQLDSSRLNDYTRQLLHEDFHPDQMGFHYNLTLMDVSAYEEEYCWFAGEETPDSSIIRTIYIPAVVSNDLGHNHPVLLRITIWR